MKNRSPVRLAQLLTIALVALFAFGATGLATAADSSSPTASAAKKKKKSTKCKKGYVKKTVKKKGKKVKKCVKKKTKVKASDLVETVTLDKIDSSVYGTKLFVTVKLKKSATTLKVSAWAKRGDQTRERVTDVTVNADQLEHSFVVKANNYPLLMDRRLKNKPLSYWAVIDGVKSNVLP